MKKNIALALAFALVFTLFALPAAHGADYSVEVNGELLQTDVSPVNVDGRILVPFRAIAEALNGEVEWDDATKTVTVTCSGSTVVLQIDNTVAQINSVKTVMDVPAQIYDGRTMVPVRFVSEALNASVSWDSQRNTAVITTDNALFEPMASFNFDEESGARVYDTAGSFNSVLCGGARRTEGIRGSAANLNGSYQYITLKSGIMNGLESFSVSTWIYYTNNSQQSRIFDFGSGNERYMSMTGNIDGEMTRFAITASGSDGEEHIDCPFMIGSGEWHHVVVTLGGGVGVIYIDGAEAGRNDKITISPADLGDFTRCYIGKSQWVDPYLSAYVDSFRIYERALSASEVKSIYENKA